MTHSFLHITVFQGRPWPGDTRKDAPVVKKTACVNKDGDDEGQQMRSSDDECVVNLAVANGLPGLIDWRDKEESSENEGENGKCGAVEDTEKWDTHVLTLIAPMISCPGNARNFPNDTEGGREIP